MMFLPFFRRSIGFKPLLRLLPRMFQVGFILILCLLMGGIVFVPSAIANIRELQEAPNQILYQSRQTLQDQKGQTWQVVLFKRIQPDEPPRLHLRLVGFPGLTVAHPQTLSLQAGTTEFRASDDLSEKSPSPNVGQYDLTEIVPQIPAVNYLSLEIPLSGDRARELRIPFFALQEWQQLAQR